jgi:sugar lactone lactonase YvrE
LTTVLGLAFDNHDRLYVLELSDAPGFPTPGFGKLVRISPSGQVQDILTGLVVPTAMTIGPDGAIYISNFGAAPPGLGQIIRVPITD